MNQDLKSNLRIERGLPKKCREWQHNPHPHCAQATSIQLIYFLLKMQIRVIIVIIKKGSIASKISKQAGTWLLDSFLKDDIIASWERKCYCNNSRVSVLIKRAMVNELGSRHYAKKIRCCKSCSIIETLQPILVTYRG